MRWNTGEFCCYFFLLLLRFPSLYARAYYTHTHARVYFLFSSSSSFNRKRRWIAQYSMWKDLDCRKTMRKRTDEEKEEEVSTMMMMTVKMKLTWKRNCLATRFMNLCVCVRFDCEWQSPPSTIKSYKARTVVKISISINSNSTILNRTNVFRSVICAN